MPSWTAAIHTAAHPPAGAHPFLPAAQRLDGTHQRRKRVWKKIINTGVAPPLDFIAAEAAQTVAAGARVAVEPLACIVLQSISR